MTDKEHGDYSRSVRMPELRLLGAKYEILRLKPPFEHVADKPGMTCFYFVKQGRLQLKSNTGSGKLYDLIPGTAIGIEDGRAHRLLSAPTKKSKNYAAAESPSVEIFTGAVDRRYTVIQKLINAVLIVPPDAEPHSTIIRHCVAALELELQKLRSSEEITRRFSEIIQLEFLQFANTQLEKISPIPESVRRDAELLRAWTAFLNAPSKRWTLATLAAEAGISRTAFATRFSKSTGATPFSALRWLRLNYAAHMLRSSQAPVAEIASKVGYGSDIALLRAFRKEFGATPYQWRLARSNDAA